MARFAMSLSITLTVNGETHRAPQGSSIADLVVLLGLNPAKVAVEHNAGIAPRARLAEFILADGDVLEIVHFVGGG